VKILLGAPYVSEYIHICIITRIHSCENSPKSDSSLLRHCCVNEWQTAALAASPAPGSEPEDDCALERHLKKSCTLYCIRVYKID
jgi:hypothetical protein